MKQYQERTVPIILPGETQEDAERRVTSNPESPRMVILRGGIGERNPKAYMDSIVSRYTQNFLHNEFIEDTLDNPYVRVLIFGINEINYELIDPR